MNVAAILEKASTIRQVRPCSETVHKNFELSNLEFSVHAMLNILTISLTIQNRQWLEAMKMMMMVIVGVIVDTTTTHFANLSVLFEIICTPSVNRFKGGCSFVPYPT